METILLPAGDPHTIARALEFLAAGELIAFPTDTIYGVGAPAESAAGIAALYQVKDRPSSKAIPVLLGDPDDMQQVATEVSVMARKLAARFWPGPLTLVVPKRPGLPEALSAEPTIGLRMPDHPTALALLRQAGPLATTSANLSGAQSAATAQEVLAQLGGRIALIIDGGRTPGGIPSTVVDCTGQEPMILRQGPVTLAQIRAAIG